MQNKRVFKVVEGSLADRFLQSRAKVRVYGGGFANGKTATSVFLALQLCRVYPGSNGLIARSTYPKLNDTIRAEFVKWCPSDWIKSFPRGQNASNTCTMKNGTTVNFRYVKQQGKAGESTTSNLLSATYDWIVVDQVEDPEFVSKDFDDLLGRLRGSTPYQGTDPTMPESGPRWLVITCNPTRNWVYRKIVRPLHVWQETGERVEELLWDYEHECPMVELFEGSTYENEENLAPDFVKTLENAYRGQMKDRFLMGRWCAYEGLVYPMFDRTMHCKTQAEMVHVLRGQVESGARLRVIESYDHGIAVPSCYLYAVVDRERNVYVVDGFYEKELSVVEVVERVKEVRRKWFGNNNSSVETNGWVYADPSVFRRHTGGGKTVGATTSDLLWDDGKGIRCVQANNDVTNGILKVQGYLNVERNHVNPFNGDHPAPHLWFASELNWIAEECEDYYWHVGGDGEREDKPRDRDDHAMDALKYLLTHSPRVASVVRRGGQETPAWMRWGERDIEKRDWRHRYG